VMPRSLIFGPNRSFGDSKKPDFTL